MNFFGDYVGVFDYFAFGYYWGMKRRVGVREVGVGSTVRSVVREDVGSVFIPLEMRKFVAKVAIHRQSIEFWRALIADCYRISLYLQLYRKYLKEHILYIS